VFVLKLRFLRAGATVSTNDAVSAGAERAESSEPMEAAIRATVGDGGDMAMMRACFERGVKDSR
jgi:hypothetical protein